MRMLAAGARHAGGLGLGADIDHVRLAGAVEMGQRPAAGLPGLCGVDS
jgi:hypothetical protein